MGLVEKIKQFFKIGNGVNIGEILAAGAKVVDVRSPGEFAGGHLRGSINIPLNMLHDKTGKLKKEDVIVTCCASGMRSLSAKAILLSNGYKHVYNGGSWHNLTTYVK
ncbi:rhodanese-like domain-containing protein [Mucilaginibacter sp.]|uniref:rhodanese-like domain-containing protein n=1 Tax=Mucilaginibacter sp. TaxID=1882438 RepID=UPI0025D7CC50|nr:rhodanese-like domain-containing protein [Mucilaginibacter sp.]